jgi:hypothetical protein
MPSLFLQDQHSAHVWHGVVPQVPGPGSAQNGVVAPAGSPSQRALDLSFTPSTNLDSQDFLSSSRSARNGAVWLVFQDSLCARRRPKRSISVSTSGNSLDLCSLSPRHTARNVPEFLGPLAKQFQIAVGAVLAGQTDRYAPRADIGLLMESGALALALCRIANRQG